MSIQRPGNDQNIEGRKQMENNNWGLEGIMDRLGWGLFFILVGILVFAGNEDWLTWGEGWFYFFIGWGGIYILGFFVRYFGGYTDHWRMFGGLIVGLSLMFIGSAFVFGFGNWWPLALIPIGIGYLAKGIWQNRSDSGLR